MTDVREKRETKSPGFDDETGRLLYLLDDSPNVWKALLVFRTRPIVPANHLVEFCVGPSLDFWM